MRPLGPTCALLVAALALAAALSHVGAALGAPGSTFAVSASATPAYGPGPLLVQFGTTVTTGTPSGYNWSFGDGTFLNGTSSALGDPTHLYEAPGKYAAEVVVHEGTDSAPATVDIHVLAEPLSVVVAATPLTGVAPLTVTFAGTVRGGSGTYVELRWTFGNGANGSGSSVQYTYASPGRYYAEFTVMDSNGSQAESGVWINASAADAPAATPGLTGLGALGWGLVGVAIGIGLALAAIPLRAWLGHRRSDEPGSPSTDGPASPPAATPPESPPASGPSGPISEPASGEVLRTSQRLLIHLAGQGTLGPYDVALPGMTQAGIGEALGVRQNALTNVLRRLADAGLLEVELRHVKGQPRRLKVYRLTPRGQILARELRQRRPPRAAE
jgi:hypothetical protein